VSDDEIYSVFYCISGFSTPQNGSSTFMIFLTTEEVKVKGKVVPVLQLSTTPSRHCWNGGMASLIL
jgi:hypothetical protein